MEGHICEAGHSFAVVAGEIGNLAGSTDKAVTEIQATISDVNIAFEALASSSKELLEFVTH